MTATLHRLASILLLCAGCTAPLVLAEAPQDDVVPFAPPGPTPDGAPGTEDDAARSDEDGSNGGINNVSGDGGDGGDE